MTRIVAMTSDRFEEMNGIDIEAWSNWATEQYGQSIVFPTKLPVYGTYLEGDPEGCFIAIDDDGRPVGYIFTRTFGKVGFFGPFGVIPKHQSSHLGKELVEASVDYMVSAGCTTIGLETMPETSYNLGLYTKLGFQLATLTLRLNKTLTEGESSLPGDVYVVRQPDNELLEQIRGISESLEDGLDLSKEVGLLRQYPLGSCLVYAPGGKIAGFALCYAFDETVGLFPGADSQNLRVRMLALHADLCGQQELEYMLGACESFARSIGRSTVTVPIYCGYDASLHTLYGLGYRIFDRYASLIKLTREPYILMRPESVCLYEWAG